MRKELGGTDNYPRVSTGAANRYLTKKQQLNFNSDEKKKKSFLPLFCRSLDIA